MNTPVTFEIAKLLKEAGLKLNFCREVFYENPNTEGEFIRTEMIHDWELIEGKDWYSAPTIAEVVMWLYEKHGIWISVFSADDVIVFYYKISSNQGSYYSPSFNSPKAAYEAAIECTLNNLI